MHNETPGTADVVGPEEKATLWAEWSMIEDALEAEDLLSQSIQTSNQYYSECVAERIKEIITRARVRIQSVVQTTLLDIYKIQEAEITSLERIAGFRSSPVKSVQEDDQFDRIQMSSSAENAVYQGSHEPVNLHQIIENEKIESQYCIESGVPVVVYSDGLGGELCFSEHNEVREPTFSKDLDYHSAHLEDTLLGSQHLFKEDSHYAGLPNRWRLHSIQEKTVDWMPEDSAQDGARQRGVAWKRRRRKFHNLMHAIGDNTCTWVALLM